MKFQYKLILNKWGDSQAYIHAQAP